MDGTQPCCLPASFKSVSSIPPLNFGHSKGNFAKNTLVTQHLSLQLKFQRRDNFLVTRIARVCAQDYLAHPLVRSA